MHPEGLDFAGTETLNNADIVKNCIICECPASLRVASVLIDASDMVALSDRVLRCIACTRLLFALRTGACAGA